MRAVLTLPCTLQESAAPVVSGHGRTLTAELSAPCRQCDLSEDPSCGCREVQESCEMFNAAMIPTLYVGATLQALERDDKTPASLRRAILWVRAWARRGDPPAQGILLSGPNGVGKSFLLAALARSLTLDRGIRCLFVDFGNLLLRLKATFDGHGTEYDVFDSLQRPEVLILDDVGSYRDSAWAREVLQTVIAARYNASARTFLSTNLSVTPNQGTLSAFEKWAGPHCASRLAELCFWLPITGPDRRRARLAALR